MGELGGSCRRCRSVRCPLSWLVPGVLYSVVGGAALASALGDAQADRACVAAVAAPAQREARLGRGASAAAAGKDRCGTRARPGRRRDPQPGVGPGPTRAVRASWSCSTSSIRRSPECWVPRRPTANRGPTSVICPTDRGAQGPRVQGPRGLAARPRSRGRDCRLPPQGPGRPSGRRLARPRHGPRPASGPDRRQGSAQPGRADADRPAGSGGRPRSPDPTTSKKPSSRALFRADGESRRHQPRSRTEVIDPRHSGAPIIGFRAAHSGRSWQLRLTRAGRDHAMAITYYKRFRMEIDLDAAVAISSLPRGFRLGAVGRVAHGSTRRSKVSQFHRRGRRVCVPLSGRSSRLPAFDVRDPAQAGLPPGCDLADRLLRRLCWNRPGGDGFGPDRGHSERRRAADVPRPGAGPGARRRARWRVSARPACGRLISRLPPKIHRRFSFIATSGFIGPRRSIKRSMAERRFRECDGSRLNSLQE